MPYRANTTIGNKITTLVMATSTVVLLLFLVCAVLIQTIHFRTSINEKLTSLAHVIALNSKEPLTFGKNWETQETLQTLKAEPYIEVASIFNHDNEVVAHYLNHEQSSFAAQIQNPVFQRSLLLNAAKVKKEISTQTFYHISVYVPVMHAGEYLGCVFIQTNNNMLLQNLLWFLIAALIILGAALATAYLLAIRLQKQITTPLHSLTQYMDEVVQDKKNATELEVPKAHLFELNLLTDNFTAMLRQIRDHEQALRHYSTDLERQVSERTLDLKNSNQELEQTILELKQAREKAIMASTAKSRFLANISHEIRTPMIGVLGMAELLQKNPLPPDQMELVNTIYNSGETLLTLLNDLLDISKIEAGKLELNLAPFCVPETIDAAVEVLANSAFSKGLDISVTIDPQIPVKLYGDAVRLRQIVLNLVSNAIKFTHYGGITVAMQGIHATESCYCIRLEVRDTGIGISTAAKKRIFEAFMQADSTTSRQYGGTGLGLAITKQLCELMHGSIHISDNNPHGTVFSLEIPFKTTAETISLREHWLSRGTNIHNLASALVVSPNPALGAVLSNLFSQYDIKVAILDSTEALKRFLTKDLATTKGQMLICLDDNLSVDCFSLAQELKNSAPAGTTMSIIYIASNAHIFNPKQRTPCGIDTFLTKPLKAMGLSKKIAGAIIQRHDTAIQTQKADRISAPASPATSHDLKQEKKDPQHAGHILLAEDQYTNQRLVRLILEQAGFTLSCAANGLSALELADREQFDLVLMDCQMPRMDGYEATRKLRQRGLKIPIIAMTAHIYEDAQWWVDAGMDGYLAKPFKNKQLLDMVAQFLSKAQELPTYVQK